MCSLFGMIDYDKRLTTRQKDKILNTLARECEVRGTDAIGIAYNFSGRMQIHKRPLPAHKLWLHIPSGVNVVMGHTRMTTQGSAKHLPTVASKRQCWRLGRLCCAGRSKKASAQRMQQMKHCLQFGLLFCLKPAPNRKIQTV